MATARPVRIVRPAAGGRGTGPAGDRVGYRPNLAGTRRATRLFGLFAALLVAIFLVFLGLAGRNTGGLAPEWPALGLLTALAGALGLWGWAITLGRTPRGAWVSDEAIVIENRWGRRRAFDGRRSGRIEVQQRNPGSWFAGDPTQLVRLSTPTGRVGQFLVGEGFFD